MMEYTLFVFGCGAFVLAGSLSIVAGTFFFKAHVADAVRFLRGRTCRRGRKGNA